VYLLNRVQILEAIDGRLPGLQIGDFDESCLQHTSYYFRLGANYEYRNDKGEWTPGHLGDGQHLTLDPGGTVRIESLEHFNLGERVLGMLGATSTLARDGLLLLHGPFIDPLFPSGGRRGHKLSGPLQMALANQTRDSQKVAFKAKIGKVAFFDISDTYPIRLVAGSVSEALFAERQRSS
jgi:deoxycytidine triphosphate deaminase